MKVEISLQDPRVSPHEIIISGVHEGPGVLKHGVEERTAHIEPGTHFEIGRENYRSNICLVVVKLHVYLQWDKECAQVLLYTGGKLRRIVNEYINT